jgi:hypothetical protein
MVALLLHTMLHDQAECGCAVDDANMIATSPQEEKPPSEASPNFLQAHCPYDKYPRSYVQNLDWLFLLDGLDEPVILRPHITPGIADTTRSEIGFDFVSVCPLRVAGEREKWAEAPCAYGESVLFQGRLATQLCRIHYHKRGGSKPRAYAEKAGLIVNFNF